jgi:hypothetical protein
MDSGGISWGLSEEIDQILNPKQLVSFLYQVTMHRSIFIKTVSLIPFA